MDYVDIFLNFYSMKYVHKNKFKEVRIIKLYDCYVDYCDNEIFLTKEQFCEKVFILLKISNYEENKSYKRVVKIYGSNLKKKIEEN